MELFQRWVLAILSGWLIAFSGGQYYLYDDDCLDYLGTNYPARPEAGALEHQIIPYCRRDNFAHDRSYALDKEIPLVTFADMHERNISSLELYELSVHLDFVEAYQAFRENSAAFVPNVSMYACWLKQRFGQQCQYTFDNQSSFDIMVRRVLTSIISRELDTSCYSHLNCTLGHISRCLDWRDVCNGRVDCWLDHVDEQFCEPLELNECGPDEYRCTNGQCIPEISLLDRTQVTDCLDQTDEFRFGPREHLTLCESTYEPSFRSTDTACYHWSVDEAPSCSYQTCTRQDPDYARHGPIEHDLFQLAANSHITVDCWVMMICFLELESRILRIDAVHVHRFNNTCERICARRTGWCLLRLSELCPPLFEFPASALGWGDLHYMFSFNETTVSAKPSIYICFDDERCANSLLPIRFSKLSNSSTFLACEPSINDWASESFLSHVIEIRQRLQQHCSLAIDPRQDHCPESTHFRCAKKCLSRHRLNDHNDDCASVGDEVSDNRSCAGEQKHRVRCLLSDFDTEHQECVPIARLQLMSDRVCEAHTRLPNFPTLCDNQISYRELIDGEIESDEDHCQAWLCDNQYTRCNANWNCPNGADETHCFHEICNGAEGYPCLEYRTSSYVCLPANKVSDGIVDCVGAMDEQTACGSHEDKRRSYRCLTNRTDGLQLVNETTICLDLADSHRSDAYCTHDRRVTKKILMCIFDTRAEYAAAASMKPPSFSLGNYSVYYHLPNNLGGSAVLFPSVSMLAARRQRSVMLTLCGGGIPIYVGNETRCLCPPYLYGARCEQQNQRVSVTLQIAAPEWRTLFVFIIYLIDESSGVVNSYHQIRYLSIRDCNLKFNFHLLYSSRPKLRDRVYYVRIDLFEMISEAQQTDDESCIFVSLRGRAVI